VRELLDARRVVGIDRAPADEAIAVFLDKPGNQLLVGPNAAERGDNAENDDLVAGLGCLEELLGLSDVLRVIFRGRLVAQLDPQRVTAELLGSYMTGVGIEATA